jgi:glutamine amidotransferase
MITIVDYGMGNLGSVLNMFRKIGVQAKISDDLEEIRNAKKLLLPGVGAFDAAMQRINDKGFKQALDHKLLVDKIPILGICLGMQLLTDSSEEGTLSGLGYIPAKTIKFDSEPDLKIPHMGWNEVRFTQKSQLTDDIDKVSAFDEHARFYFVHSYKVIVYNEENSILKATHGSQEFEAAIQLGNIYGAQFHPEKSHKFGMQILKNFAELS